MKRLVYFLVAVLLLATSAALLLAKTSTNPYVAGVTVAGVSTECIGCDFQERFTGGSSEYPPGSSNDNEENPDCGSEPACWDWHVLTPDLDNTTCANFPAGVDECVEFYDADAGWEQLFTGATAGRTINYFGFIMVSPDYSVAQSVFFQTSHRDQENDGCRLELWNGDGSVYIQANDGVATDTGVNLSVDTAYYFKVKINAVGGSGGGDDECSVWIKSDPDAAWGSEHKVSDGTFPDNQKAMMITMSRKGYYFYFADVRISATESDIDYSAY